MAEALTAIRLYTGADGLSHVERTLLPLDALAKATGVRFAETPAGSAFDWHTAPVTQYVVTLSGTLEFVTRDGESFQIGPGEVLLAEDTTGSGHRWRLIDDQPWRRVYITLP